MVQDCARGGFGFARPAVEFHSMLSWGSRNVIVSLGVRKTIPAMEYSDGLETKLESHRDGDLWIIRVQQRHL